MMYKLPKIPYTMDKDQSAEIPFRGINYSDRLSAGDLADSHGISLRRWPLVTNKRGRKKDDEELAFVTVHDGRKIKYIKGGAIKCGETTLAESWDGEQKRFANVNSKTVIMPDKKYIEFDVTNPRLCELEATAEVINATFTKDKISGKYEYIATVYGGSFKAENGKRTLSGTSGGWRVAEFTSVTLSSISSSGESCTRKYAVDGNQYWTFCERHYNVLDDNNFLKESILVEIHSEEISFVGQLTRCYQEYTNDPYSGEPISQGYFITIECGKEFYGNEQGCTYQVSTIYDTDWQYLGEIIGGGIVGYALCFFGATKNTGYYKITKAAGNSLEFDVPAGELFVDEELGDYQKLEVYRNDGFAFKHFKNGDTVTVTGCVGNLDVNNTTFTVQNVTGNTIYAAADIFVEGDALGMVTITRKVPELDFICEAENRLWGCNNTENVIYISALGDPTNMYTYEGLTTDSFATAVGSPGEFTGCCRYGSSVLFFKEDKIHKILGTGPADYTLYSYDVEGIQAGSDRSPVVINEVLYYKGTHGIYAYDGGVPTLISECFGERIFYDAVAGTDGVSYFVSMRDERYVWYLFSYNTTTGIWTLEDKGFEAKDAMRVGMELYFLDKEGHLWKENAVSDVSRSEWMMQFAPLYETMNGKKTYSRLLLRAEIPRGSYMVIEIRCDGGRWMELGKIVGKSDGVVPIRIPVNRCDKFEIKLRGKGEFVLRSMLREFYVSEEP